MGVVDLLTIRRVANGWIILPGGGADGFTHVATTPAEPAGHVSAWAAAQVARPVIPKGGGQGERGGRP